MSNSKKVKYVFNGKEVFIGDTIVITETNKKEGLFKVSTEKRCEITKDNIEQLIKGNYIKVVPITEKKSNNTSDRTYKLVNPASEDFIIVLNTIVDDAFAMSEDKSSGRIILDIIYE